MRYRIASTTGRRADLYFPYTTLATITEPKSLPNSLNITCDDTVPCGTDLPVTKGDLCGETGKVGNMMYVKVSVIQCRSSYG